MYRYLKWSSKINRQKCDDKLINRFREKFGKGRTLSGWPKGLTLSGWPKGLTEGSSRKNNIVVWTSRSKRNEIYGTLAGYSVDQQKKDP